MKEPRQRSGQGAGPAANEGRGGGAGARALVRFTGELTTKSARTRRHFQRRLGENLRDAFGAGSGPDRIRSEWSRIFIRTEDEESLAPLSRVFGVSSWSLLEGTCEPRLPAIVATGRGLYAGRVRGRRFAVRARRSGEQEFQSGDVNRELGAALNAGAEVDLDDPEITVRVEVRPDRAYFFSERRPGAGGLPVGVQGTAVALVSGGYDSAVAAWMSLRRGMELEYVFCNLGGGAYRRMVLEVTKVLADRWSYGHRPRIHVVDFEELVENMRSRVTPSHLQVVLKRLMYRAASRVAGRTGADAIVTGESVGQVSSQTLPNLRAIQPAASLPVLRPLCGMDKQEIVDRAGRIGTADLSSRVREYCGLVERRPVTACDPDRARREEEAVDAGILERALASAEVVSLRDLAAGELATSGLFVSRIDATDVVIDTREEERYGRWHWPGASRRSLDELRESFGALDRDRTYVLYCERGLKTARLADTMQSEGYEAYSFRGGAERLRKEASGEAPPGAEPPSDAPAGDRELASPEPR